MEGAIIALVFLAAFAILIILIALSRLLLISQPNEVIVLSGRKRKLASGDIVGYRIIRGGRAFRMPFLEKASRMSLETIPIDLSVTNAYSKGGIPLAMEAVANIKIDSVEPAFGNAVERFLTMSESEIHSIAKDTLEGNLRGVLASLTPEEVNEDRLKFAELLIEEAVGDLSQLGLKLDILKITNISDDRDYLDSIGRMKTAEVIANAKKAEANKKADAEEAEAKAEERSETAKAKAQQEIETARIESRQNVSIANATKQAEAKEAEAAAYERAEIAKAKAQRQIEIEQNKLRVIKAELEKEAIIKEKEAEVAGRKAEAIFEQEVEAERIVLQKKKLIADLIEPAKAKKEAMELEAKGKSAYIITDGEAQIAVLNLWIKAYLSAEGHGDKVLMLKMLPEIVGKLSDTIKGVNIDKITMIDGGGNNGGNNLSRLLNQIPGSVVNLAEMIENATGVDILSHFRKDEPAEEDVTNEFVDEEGGLKE